jgi:hypothetical protein
MTIYNNTISLKSFKQRQLIDFLSILRGIVVQVFQVCRMWLLLMDGSAHAQSTKLQYTLKKILLRGTMRTRRENCLRKSDTKRKPDDL